MCGVIGLVYENHHPQLGLVAAELLRTLEYRGYDSTGAAIQGPGEEVALRKGVGAPSLMVHELGIVDLAGSVLCGQVRWATFGAVTEKNSQPHVVRCKRYLYGAHNGNVTNCDDLKRWLEAQGHQVLSDNDGEMVVHTVEHCFALALDREAREAGDAGGAAAERDPALRRRAMRAAIVDAAARLQGSYAAVIVDPLTRTLWAIKQGSSLYFGFGPGDGPGGRFAIASSDLSAVLRLSRVLLPLSEGEFVEYTAAGHEVYAAVDRRLRAADGERLVRAGEVLPRAPVRSRLRAKDTALRPGFSTFMEQEIAAQPQALRGLISLLLGGSPALRRLAPALSAQPAAERQAVSAALDALRDLPGEAQLRARFHALVDLPALRRLLGAVPAPLRDELLAPLAGAAPEDALASMEAGLLADLLPATRDEADRLALRLLDALLEQGEVEELGRLVDRFTATCQAALRGGGRIFVVCCGSSFHAAKAGALFFNEIAQAPLQPVLPGEFRAEHARSLRDGDLIVAVSQSGETKDLIDVLNQVAATGRRVSRVGLVNNLNSTLAQEKCELVLPLRCGPEVAVPATKSFLSQLAVFYCLALRLGERLCAALPPGPERAARQGALRARLDGLPSLPDLVAEASTCAADELERAAQLLYLRPSVHILGTRHYAVALEGALKIREVVLNHTQGYEGSEFKHGPNTILGWSTLFGPREVAALLQRVSVAAARVGEAAAARGWPPERVGRLVQALCASALPGGGDPLAGLGPEEAALLEGALPRAEVQGALGADYPLLYLTGPDELDVNLTVSQINTHKIRGAMTLILAEEHPALAQAAAKAPVDNPAYEHAYVRLPRTGDTLLTAFTATVALQRLALRMSLLKKQHLDRLGIADHGVHPDVPKNVSKSITVD